MAWEHKHRVALFPLLARLYPKEGDQRTFLKRVDLDETRIEFDSRAINTWRSIVEFADLQQELDTVLKIALEDNPKNPLLKEIKSAAPPELPKGPEMDAGTWKGDEPKNLEKITGAVSALVHVKYLAQGLECAKAVALIQFPKTAGTGFLVGDDILITNHHVIRDAGAAKEAKARFNYQHALTGGDEKTEEFDLDPDTLFQTSKENDWTLVKVKGAPSKTWGSLRLEKRTVEAGDRVNIIQHAGGGPKQISFFSNIVAFVGNGRVQYLTDTLPGSSGSPVFDRDWNVVALHHSGGWIEEPNATTKTTNYRNEGIDVALLVDAIAALGKPAPNG